VVHLFLSCAVIAGVILQSGADPFLARFAGVWTGTGIVLNQPSQISLAWTWELSGQFLRLTFKNQMPKATFEGHAYYRSAGGRYRGMWFDNAGMLRPIEATRDGEALISRWGTAETEEGETIYRLLSDSEMEIVDRVKSKDGTWREFGRSRVRKN
jgi:hypothetical protein